MEVLIQKSKEIYYVWKLDRANKTRKQIKDLPNSFLVKDDVEFGVNNSIPLLLFGFLD